MTKVDMEKALDFPRLHELGRPYLDIAKENGLNIKTVAYWVRKAKKFSKDQHCHEIGKDLDNIHIQEHHQVLLVTALGISKAVSTPPQLVGSGQRADVLVDHHVLNALQELKETLAERGIDTVSDELGRPRSDDWDLKNGMAEKLLKGLFQHLPELQEAVEQWASDWQRFRDEKDELVKDTAGALVQSGLDSDAADRRASSAVRKTLERERGNWADTEPPDPHLNFAVGQVKPRWNAALDALTRIHVSVATCRDFLEDVLLGGGPPGRCNSCPGR